VRTQRGFVLLFVLWVLALLALIAASFVLTSHSAILAARHRADEIRAKALDDAGINRAIFALLDPTESSRWRQDGTPRQFVFGGAVIWVSLSAENGKIDLNAAPGPVLEGLFIHTGAAPALCESLARQILDRRAARAISTGVEPAGALGRTGDPAFTMISQLGGLDGMTPALYARLKPLVTVYSGLPTIDPNTAPADVLLSLPGGDAREIARFLAARAQAQENAAAPASIAGFLRAAPGGALTIRAETSTPNGGDISRSETILLKPSGSPPLIVLDAE